MGSFTKREQIVILFIVLIIILSISFKFFLKDLFKPVQSEVGLMSKIDVEANLGISEEDLTIADDNSLIMVHISGQVYNSGIIQLVMGDRVIDAVKLAGGLTKDADLDRINLAKKVVDEEKIYIPKIGEVEFNENTLISKLPNNNDSNSGKININLCSSKELEELPGIGEVIANRIIEYRSSQPFRNIDELKNVSGIGDKKFEDIKDLVIVK